MENGRLIHGLEDGTIDVERLLVEPHDGHVSMGNVMCFNKSIPTNTMNLEDVSCRFGGSGSGTAREGEDILNGEVLDAMPSEVEAGYLRLHDDEFGSMEDEYLLGCQFTESITNLDYVSIEGLKTSFPDNQMQMLISEEPSISPRLSTLQNIGKFDSSSSCSLEDIFSDENDGSKIESNNESELAVQDEETDMFQQKEALATMPAQANCTDVLPTQKRSRKPTQRYIDELTDPLSIYSKKRRGVSSSTIKVKEKSVRVKDHKKCHMGSTPIRLPAKEESSVIAIQVPFASLGHNECPKSQLNNKVECVENLMTYPKGKRSAPVNQKKRDECITSVYLKNRESHVTSDRKGDDCVISAPLKKRDKHLIKDASQNKKDDCDTALHYQKKRDDGFFLSGESPEEVSAQRKHHRLWTIAEVRKLIDGVSQYGVGRWSRIKKLFFSTSAHRSSVDLKDKWRNLLKASGILEQGNHQQGGKKRNLPWRPLPKSILHRVCELAEIYPYPKDQRPKKIAHINININEDSPDRSTDITLGDYKRILRSISDN